MNWFTRILQAPRPPKPRPEDVAGMPIDSEKLRTMRADDQFLVSYPRSGNTWTRYLLLDVILFGRPDLEVPSHPGSLVPDLHIQPLANEAQVRFGLARRIFKSHNIRDVRGQRLAYLFRNPVDALISYYHFHLRHESLRALAAEGPDAFCLRMLPGWCEHQRLGLEAHTARPSEVHFACYEMLKKNPVDELRKFAAFFHLPATEKVLADAVAKNAFEHWKKAEQQKPQSDDATPFFRKGEVGGGRSELREETVATIEREGLGLYEAGRRLAEAR